MKAAVERALNVPEKTEELSPLEQLLKGDVKKREENAEETALALSQRDNKALMQRIRDLEEQVQQVQAKLVLKEQADAQAKAFNTKVPARHGHPWGQSEIRALGDAWEKTGKTVKQLAEEHERSERAIEMMLEQRGYVLQPNYNIMHPQRRYGKTEALRQLYEQEFDSMRRYSRSVCAVCGAERCPHPERIAKRDPIC